MCLCVICVNVYLSMTACFYPFVWLPICVYMHICIFFVSIYLWLYVCISICLSVSLSLCVCYSYVLFAAQSGLEEHRGGCCGLRQSPAGGKRTKRYMSMRVYTNDAAMMVMTDFTATLPLLLPARRWYRPSDRRTTRQ